jgi:hypothetical protein
MSPVLRTPWHHWAVAGLAALLVFLAGAVFAGERSDEVRSDVRMVLVPSSEEDEADALEAFARSGAAGTFVELLSSRAVTSAADGGTVEARAIPDSRIIQVAVTREREAQPALRRVIRAALSAQQRLDDRWEMRQIESTSLEEVAGPSDALVLAASALLGLLAGIGALSALRAVRIRAQAIRDWEGPAGSHPVGEEHEADDPRAIVVVGGARRDRA